MMFLYRSNAKLLHLLRRPLLQLGGKPSGQHHFQNIRHPVPGAGARLLIPGQDRVQRVMEPLGRPDIPVRSSQTEKNQIHDTVVNDIVAFIVQLAVDVGQKPANGFHRQSGLQHVDDDDAAQLAAVVLFFHRRRQKTSLDPILHGIGLQSGNLAHLGQDQAAGDEQGGKQLVGRLRPGLIDLQDCAGQNPVHFHHSSISRDVQIITHGHVIVNRNFKTTRKNLSIRFKRSSGKKTAPRRHASRGCGTPGLPCIGALHDWTRNVPSGKVLLQWNVQHTGNHQGQYGIGQHIASVVHQGIQRGVIKGPEAGDCRGLVNPVNGHTADKMNQKTHAAA